MTQCISKLLVGRLACALNMQRPLTWFLRSIIVLPAFVGIMLPRAETDDAFFKAYDYCVKASILQSFAGSCGEL